MGRRYCRLGCSYRIAPLGQTKRGSFVFSAFGFDTREKPLASGSAALPTRKPLFGEAIGRECDPQRHRSQEEMKSCVAPYNAHQSGIQNGLVPGSRRLLALTCVAHSTASCAIKWGRDADRQDLVKPTWVGRERRH